MAAIKSVGGASVNKSGPERFEFSSTGGGNPDNLYQLVFNNTYQFIGILDRDGILLDANATALSFVNREKKDVIGRYFWETEWWTHDPAQQEKVRQTIQSIHTHKQTVHFEVTHPRSDGTVGYFVFSIKPLLDNNGNILYLIPEGRDITERKEAEKQIQLLNQELESKVSERTRELSEYLEKLKQTQQILVESKKLAGLGQLVVGISHEMNTPVGTAITGITYLEQQIDALLSRIKKTGFGMPVVLEDLEDIRQIAAVVNSSLHHAAELLDTFKNTALVSAVDDLIGMNAREFIESTLEPFSSEIEAHSHTVEIHVSDNAVIRSHPVTLSNILNQLISNALNHGFEGLESGRIMIELTDNDAHYDLVFSDNGHGVVFDEVDQIFNPFFTTKRNIGKSGLGMNIVYNQVTQVLKGTITVSSKKNEGCKFVIDIPKAL